MTAGITNVLLAGVGGQGVLLASETLALAALEEGQEAKQSEVHGVAQRGGSVVSHVRFGGRVHSPLIPCGETDVLYAAERLEALRYAHYVRPEGVIVMDERAIKPIGLPGAEAVDYPEGAVEFLRGKGRDVRAVAALRTALELGDARAANVVLLGALAECVGISEAAWRKALEARLPAAVLELNRRAFQAGRELGVVAPRA